MERQATFEPGLLSLFRMLAMFRVGMAILGALGAQSHGGPWLAVLVGGADGLILLAYLASAGLSKWLGRLYLPIGLAIAAIGPLLTQHIQVLVIGSPSWTALLGVWQLLPILLIPVVLVAWQYGFRAALVVIIGTLLMDVGLTILFKDSIGFTQSFPSETYMSLALGYGVALVSRTATSLVTAYMISRLVKAQRKQRAELARANSRLVGYASTLEQLTISRERNRMARELHDTLAHSLSAMAVQLEAAHVVWETAPDEAHKLLTQSLDTTRDGLAETRRALQALRASPLDDLGLGLAIRALGESVGARYHLAVEVQAPDTLKKRSPAIEQCVYRVAQESLENVARHANARRARVRLESEGELVVLTVTDDGQGFDVDAALADERFGLRGLRERAEVVGGELEVTSSAGRGTTVRLTVEDTAWSE